MERQAKHCAKKGRAWSRGMIPPLGGGGLGSDSPSAAPYFFACTFHVSISQYIRAYSVPLKPRSDLHLPPIFHLFYSTGFVFSPARHLPV